MAASTATRAVRVLGVDPGLTRCGLGIVDGPSSRPTVVLADVVRTPQTEPTERRLAALHAAVVDVLTEHRPDVLACERVLFSANVRTAMATGQAAGVVLLAAATAGIPVASYSPNEIKLSVAGHGSADKDGVGRMVAAQLGLDGVPDPPDIADALAAALTHLFRGNVITAASGPGEVASGWEAVLARPHVRVAGGTGGPSVSERGGAP